MLYNSEQCPIDIYLFKFNNGNTRTMCEICSKLTIQTSNTSIDIVLESLLLTLNKFHTLFWCFHCWLWISKCWLGSTLPINMSSRTDSSLKSINFSRDEDLEIIKNLNLGNFYGPDKISFRMIRICGNSLCKPIEIIFKSCVSKRLTSKWLSIEFLQRNVLFIVINIQHSTSFWKRIGLFQYATGIYVALQLKYTAPVILIYFSIKRAK